jgi:Rod binding domain-containing protein
MRIGPENVSGLNGHEENAVSQRLVRAAQEFEAQMMKELLKPMTGQDALTTDTAGDAGDGGATGALGEFASEALGQAISRNGGFGIAGRIVQELSQTGHRSTNGKTGRNTHADFPTRITK